MLGVGGWKTVRWCLGVGVERWLAFRTSPNWPFEELSGTFMLSLADCKYMMITINMWATHHYYNFKEPIKSLHYSDEGCKLCHQHDPTDCDTALTSILALCAINSSVECECSSPCIKLEGLCKVLAGTTQADLGSFSQQGWGNKQLAWPIWLWTPRARSKRGLRVKKDWQLYINAWY